MLLSSAEDAYLDELIACREVVQYGDEAHGIRQMPPTCLSILG